MERAAEQEEDVTNLGMKIVGDELEVGFTVSSREEFDAAVARLQTVAATIWATPNANDEMPERMVIQKAPTVMEQLGYAEERKAAAAWREDQGLR